MDRDKVLLYEDTVTQRCELIIANIPLQKHISEAGALATIYRIYTQHLLRW